MYIVFIDFENIQLKKQEFSTLLVTSLVFK